MHLSFMGKIRVGQADPSSQISMAQTPFSFGISESHR